MKIMKMMIKERRRFNIFLFFAFAVLFIVSLIFLNYYNEMKKAVMQGMSLQYKEVMPIKGAK